MHRLTVAAVLGAVLALAGLGLSSGGASELDALLGRIEAEVEAFARDSADANRTVRIVLPDPEPEKLSEHLAHAIRGLLAERLAALPGRTASRYPVNWRWELPGTLEQVRVSGWLPGDMAVFLRAQEHRGDVVIFGWIEDLHGQRPRRLLQDLLPTDTPELLALREQHRQTALPSGRRLGGMLGVGSFSSRILALAVFSGHAEQRLIGVLTEEELSVYAEDRFGYLRQATAYPEQHRLRPGPARQRPVWGYLRAVGGSGACFFVVADGQMSVSVPTEKAWLLMASSRVPDGQIWSLKGCGLAHEGVLRGVPFGAGLSEASPRVYLGEARADGRAAGTELFSRSLVPEKEEWDRRVALGSLSAAFPWFSLWPWHGRGGAFALCSRQGYQLLGADLQVVHTSILPGYPWAVLPAGDPPRFVVGSAHPDGTTDYLRVIVHDPAGAREVWRSGNFDGSITALSAVRLDGGDFRLFAGLWDNANKSSYLLVVDLPRGIVSAVGRAGEGRR
jgi:hypothetical protein